MLISTKYKFVFLSMPKCASQSTETLLKPYCDIVCSGPARFRHVSYRGYVQHFKPFVQNVVDADSLETICLVRNPFSWLDSWYRYRSGKRFRNPNDSAHKSSTAGISFSEFIEAYTSSNPPTFANMGSQYEFVMNGEGEIGVDKMFCYEKIDEFLDHMSHKIGQKLVLPSQNISPQKNYDSALMFKAEALRLKFVRRLGLKRAPSKTTTPPELPEALLNKLKDHVARDFELYNKIDGLAQNTEI